MAHFLQLAWAHDSPSSLRLNGGKSTAVEDGSLFSRQHSGAATKIRHLAKGNRFQRRARTRRAVSMTSREAQSPIIGMPAMPAISFSARLRSAWAFAI